MFTSLKARILYTTSTTDLLQYQNDACNLATDHANAAMQ